MIDASPGLGEAVVSGAVNPDHFVVNTATGEIVERSLGDKRVAVLATAGGGTRRVELEEDGEASLTDAQIRALAELGARVEAHYGEPQDTEWAIDGDGKIWLLQARPITTLFPLGTGAPATDDDLRAYFSFNVAQECTAADADGHPGVPARRLLRSHARGPSAARLTPVRPLLERRTDALSWT